MSTSLFSQLDMGKRSLMAQQAGMSTTGHNIANVGNADYSRQKVELAAQHPVRSRFGSGVDLQGVDRVADHFLTQRVISEQSRGGQLDVRDTTLKRLENLLNDEQGFGLRAALNQFWSAWSALANSPESQLQRTDLANASNALGRRINGLYNDMESMRQELNGRVAERVDRVNALARQIALLNSKIQQTDHGAGEANDLRDQREAALKDLAKLVQIDWYEDDKKVVNVSIGQGFPLVQAREVHPLEASHKSEESRMFSVRGLDSKGISRDLTRDLKSGELAELVALRDDTIPRYTQRLDELASELAYKVNRLHATGTGLNSAVTELRSSFALKPDARAMPLPFLRDGKFRVQLVDPANKILETYEVPVHAGRDTLRDIVARINETVGDRKLVQARINQDGSVSLVAQGANRLILGDDDSELSVLLGFNNFFETLEGAKDIHVSERLLKNPDLISTGKGLLPGDNQVALAIQGLQSKPSMEGDSITFDEFYNGMMADLGLMIDRSQNDKKNQDVILNQFQKLRDEVSSVNMDEEVADMVQYQRGFEAAAKFLSTVDDMTKTVINM